MRRRVFCVFYVVFIVFMATSLFSISYESPTLLVTEEEIREYLEHFLTTFAKELENRFDKNSTIYSENINYTVHATISKANGVGIELFPSDSMTINFELVENRIEQMIFPNLSFNVTSPEFEAATFVWTGEAGGTMFGLGNSTGFTLKNLVFITNQGNFLELQEKGSEAYLFDITLDGRYYHTLILKGGNEREYWTKAVAESDAKMVLETKSFLGFQKAQAIKEAVAYPIFVEMLSGILWKQNNARNINYSLLQHEADMNSIRDIAMNTYHFESAFIDKVYNWLDTITPKPIELPEPIWYSIEPWSWLLGGVLAILLEKSSAFIFRKAREPLRNTKEVIKQEFSKLRKQMSKWFQKG